MIGALVRSSRFLARQPAIRIQILQNLCDKPPSQKDFLSKSVGGDPFYIMPFSFRNHTKFTILFMLFFGIGFWAPPAIVHLLIWKRAQ